MSECMILLWAYSAWNKLFYSILYATRAKLAFAEKKLNSLLNCIIVGWHKNGKRAKEKRAEPDARAPKRNAMNWNRVKLKSAKAKRAKVARNRQIRWIIPCVSDRNTPCHAYMSTQREVLEGQTGSHRAKRANFGRGSGGPPPWNFKNLHCKWCNLRYSWAIFVNIISLYCNKTCINYASFITI